MKNQINTFADSLLSWLGLAVFILMVILAASCVLVVVLALLCLAIIYLLGLLIKWMVQTTITNTINEIKIAWETTRLWFKNYKE